MTSWRDSMSPQGQQDMDQLLNVALPFGQQMLNKEGEFYPYGAALSSAGEVRMVMGHSGEEHPASSDLREFLFQALASQRDSLRGAAVATNVRLPQQASDAIQVEVEHAEGIAIVVLLPYTKKRFGRGISYSQLTAGAGERRLWPA